MSAQHFDLVQQIATDRELVFRFFAVFSRFECALKRSGFVKKDRNDGAKADWKAFENSLRGLLSSAEQKGFEESCLYLLREPPKSQVVREAGKLGWEQTVRRSDEFDEAYLLRLVRTVRNNLFHGGKYPYPECVVEDAARNRQLLHACLAVLDYCMALNAAVEENFRGVA